MEVPAGSPAGFTLISFPPANSTRVPCSSSAERVSSSRREMEAIDGRASPRNPSVEIESKSSAVRNFEVACRSNASRASSWFIPVPSSITRIMRLPPDSVSIRIDRAPASSAFSSSSFTTDAGRSTTSPAAILFATFSASMRIRLIGCVSWALCSEIPNLPDCPDPLCIPVHLLPSPLGQRSAEKCACRRNWR